MQTDAQGRGVINILAADKLLQRAASCTRPSCCGCCRSCSSSCPRSAIRDKPKLVFFFDEAHLLFNDAPAGAAREDRAGGAADPLQGRRRVSSSRRTRSTCPTRCSASSATACSTRCAPSRRATRRRCKSAARDDARQPEARRREGDHRARRRRGAGVVARREGPPERRRARLRRCRRLRASARSPTTSARALMRQLAASPATTTRPSTASRPTRCCKGRAAAGKQAGRCAGRRPTGGARAAGRGGRGRRHRRHCSAGQRWRGADSRPVESGASAVRGDRVADRRKSQSARCDSARRSAAESADRAGARRRRPLLGQPARRTAGTPLGENSTMDLGIAGKRALVCGASKGLGYGCALSLAREGVQPGDQRAHAGAAGRGRAGGSRDADRRDGHRGGQRHHHRRRAAPRRSPRARRSTSWSTTPAARRPATSASSAATTGSARSTPTC